MASAGSPVLPIGLLAAAGFLGSAGSRIVDPILHPIADDFAVAVPDLWVVIAAFTLPYGLAQLVLGPVGDRFGKLRVILGALTLYALFTAACAMAGTLSHLVTLRALAGAASAGLIPVSMAYIGDAVPYGQRQVTLGRFLTGVVLAQILAGPLGGIFGTYLGWRGVFLLLAAIALGVAALFLRRVRTLPDRRQTGGGLRLDAYAAPYAALARRPFARFILVAAALDGAALAGCFPFLAPFLHERFGLPYAGAGAVLACAGLGAFAYTRLARLLLARIGEPGLIALGGALVAAALLVAATAPDWRLMVPAELALGLGFFSLHGVLQARATEMLPEARGTAVATFACTLFLGQSVGALAMGALIARWGYEPAFLVDAAAILILTAWLFTRLRAAPSSAHA